MESKAIIRYITTKTMNETPKHEEIAELTAKTIDDFGEQWSSYKNSPGYYGSKELLQDLFGTLLETTQLEEKRVAEIGSGTGRIVDMLLDAGATNVMAIEPAKGAFDVLVENTTSRKDRITYLQKPGNEIPKGSDLDYVFSIGVIHHIPDPKPVIAASYDALKSGGKMLIWIYGHEGNEAYLSFALPLRKVTKLLPHPILVVLTWILVIFLDIYIALCRFIPLPMHVYMREVLANFKHSVRRMTIYDQLNPAYAKYYFQNDAEALLTNAGFTDVNSYHRHGYSWTVIGTKS